MKDYISSSIRQDWETPPEIFDPLHARFYFTVDAAANQMNTKLECFYEDAFAQSWKGERVWCNPPYGREQARWVERAAKRNHDLACLLLPARTDTKVWHDFIFPSAEVWFLRGRIRFRGGDSAAPFPSALVFFRPADEGLVVRTGTINSILEAT